VENISSMKGVGRLCSGMGSYMEKYSCSGMHAVLLKKMKEKARHLMAVFLGTENESGALNSRDRGNRSTAAAWRISI